MGALTERIEWQTVPDPVRAALEKILGARVVTAHNVRSGFSLGTAASCALDDGRQVFVKACSVEVNKLTPALLRREARVLAELPAGYPAPRLLGVVDDASWVAIAVEHIDGRMPEAPLSADDIGAVLGLLDRLAAAGTPSPIAWLGAVGSDEFRRGSRWAWQRVVADGLDERLDPWTLARLDELVSLEAGWVEAAAGDTLVHGDFRADNVIIPADGRGAIAVDWPAAEVGAPWLDLVGLLPALHMEGAPPPAEVFASTAMGRAADADRVDRYLAAIAGYFTRQSLLPQPAGVRAVREFQRLQGEICRRWLAERRGWPLPPFGLLRGS